MWRAANMRLQTDERIVAAARGSDIGQWAEFHVGGVIGLRLYTFSGGAQRQLRETLGLCIKLLGAQKQCFRRQRGALWVTTEQAVTVFGVLPETLKRDLQIIVQHQRASGGQIVKHRRRIIKKQGQVVFDASRGKPRPHILVDPAFGRIAFEQFAPLAAEMAARGLIHRKLSSRQQTHLGHRV